MSRNNDAAEKRDLRFSAAICPEVGDEDNGEAGNVTKMMHLRRMIR